jgi:hypothetical protein
MPQAAALDLVFEGKPRPLGAVCSSIDSSRGRGGAGAGGRAGAPERRRRAGAVACGWEEGREGESD